MTATLYKLKEPVLVTGAAGFIGVRLVKRLLAEGRKVRAFDVAGCPRTLDAHANLAWWQGDITSEIDVKRAVTGVGIVFHLAAVVGDWGPATRHKAVTVEGTRHLFQAVLDTGGSVRVVLASSIVVYGDQLNDQRCHEGLAHGKPCGPYSECKQLQEVLAGQFCQQGLDVRVVRPANVYGAGSKPWVDDLCVELQKGNPSLIDGGDYNAGLVHVDNVVEILLLAAGKPNAAGQIYNAADEEGITWKCYMTDMATLCGASAPRSIPRILATALAAIGEPAFRWLRIKTRPPLTSEALNLVGSSHCIDMGKTRRELGFVARKCYVDGMQEIGEYLQKISST